MLHASTQKLIQKLCDLTQSGDIVWQEGAGDFMVFETEGYRVEAASNPPSVRLLRNDGKELESASAADLQATPWPDSEGNYAARVSEMVRRAQRTARGADHAISRILSSLSAPAQKASDPAPVLTAQSAPEPPPSPHTIPEPPVKPPHADTAIEMVLAPKTQVEVGPEVERPAVADAMESAPVEPEQEAAVSAADEELPLEEAPPPRPEPQFRIPVFAAPPIAPGYALVRNGFGAMQSFALYPAVKPEPATPAVSKPAPLLLDTPVEPKVTSTGLFITGISAVSRQSMGGEATSERKAAPPPPAAQAPRVEPKPEPKREPAPVADVYKPWN